MDAPLAKRARVEQQPPKDGQRDAAAGSWTRCMAWLAAKKRFCSVARAPCSMYCGHHNPDTALSEADVRVPCPVDNTHTVRAAGLAAHVARCSSRPAAVQERWCRVGANAGSCPPEEAAAVAAVRAHLGVPHSDAPPAALPAVVVHMGGGSGGGISAPGAPVAAAPAPNERRYVERLLEGAVPGLDSSVGSLCARFLAWAVELDGGRDAPVEALCVAQSIPALHEALAAWGGSGVAQEGASCAAAALALPPHAMEAAIASKRAVFRHALQQACILGHLLADNGGVSPAAVPPVDTPPADAPPADAPLTDALKLSADATVAAPPPLTLQVLPARAVRAAFRGGLGLPPPVFVELGAGRGMLALALTRVLPGARVVLLDRASVRGKADTALRRRQPPPAGGAAAAPAAAAPAAAAPAAAAPEDAGADAAGGHDDGVSEAGDDAALASNSAPLGAAFGAAFARVRVDLADAVLAALPVPALPPPQGQQPGGGGSSGAPPLVALGKHLCGAATDMALRALAREGGCGCDGCIASAAGDRSVGDRSAGSSDACGACCPSQRLNAAGGGVCAFAVATCCHHRASWAAYVGKRLWREALGPRAAATFEAVRFLCSWASCAPPGDAVAAAVGAPAAAAVATAAAAASPAAAQAWCDALGVVGRARVGRAVRRAIDAGRLDFVRHAKVLGASGAGGAGGSSEGSGDTTILRNVVFCSARVTRENTLLLGGRRGGEELVVAAGADAAAVHTS